MLSILLKKGIEIVELIQVCYETVVPETEQREIKALIEAGEELRAKNLTIITWDKNKEMEKDGKTIKFKRLWEWLLDSQI